ncbi:response regulator [Paenibacillus daejeonensis]|uniref:response regulator n=1 Tax=Paenibacillus daejeonensis TaxID=135193 RepID=UPI00036F7E63|nr:response regulator [Paenibacillus daejeonensis]
MNNYQQTLYNHMNDQFSQWLEAAGSTIDREEVYRFLHSLSGTAGTIGLHELSDVARERMERLHETAQTTWTPADVEQLLSPLIAISKGEALHRTDAPVAFRDASLPLILILEREDAVLAQLQQSIEQLGYVTISSQTPEEAVQLFESQRPDGLVVDVESGGLDALIALEGPLQKQPVPVTVIGTEVAAAASIQAYRMGADDYMAKPLPSPLLSAVLNRQITKKRQVERLIDTDEVTGAFRHHQLEQLYNDQLLQAGATGRPFVLILITLDRLEGIHTRYEELPSEDILQTVAARLMEDAAGSYQGKVIRYKWDSFVILLPEPAADAGDRLAKEWRRELTVLLQGQGQPFHALTATAQVNEPDRPLDYWLALLHEGLGARSVREED